MPPPVGQRQQVVVQKAAGQCFRGQCFRGQWFRGQWFRAGAITAQLLAESDGAARGEFRVPSPIDRQRSRGFGYFRGPGHER